MVALPSRRTDNAVHTPFVSTDSGKAIYQDGRYLEHSPSWHMEESPFKVKQILRMMKRQHLAPKTARRCGFQALQTYTALRTSREGRGSCQGDGNQTLIVVANVQTKRRGAPSSCNSDGDFSHAVLPKEPSPGSDAKKRSSETPRQFRTSPLFHERRGFPHVDRRGLRLGGLLLHPSMHRAWRRIGAKDCQDSKEALLRCGTRCDGALSSRIQLDGAGEIVVVRAAMRSGVACRAQRDDALLCVCSRMVRNSAGVQKRHVDRIRVGDPILLRLENLLWEDPVATSRTKAIRGSSGSMKNSLTLASLLV